MRNITLMIGGRDYTVACAAGEEAHVAGLGRIIDEKLAAIPPAVGQSEARSLLFAALLLADEVHEARTAGDDAGPAMAGETAADAAAAARDAGAAHSRTLAHIAARLENLAAHLEGTPASA